MMKMRSACSVQASIQNTAQRMTCCRWVREDFDAEGGCFM
jgi:hypothetical protein